MSTKAGMFAGEVTPSAPADNAPTDKAKSYVWMEYGAGSEITTYLAEHTVHYWDFEYELDAYGQQSQQYWFDISKYFGYGENNLMHMKVSAVGALLDGGIGLGRDGDNCCLFSGNDIDDNKWQVFRPGPGGGGAFSPQSIGDPWIHDEFTHVFWLYPTSITARQTIMSKARDEAGIGFGLTERIEADGTVSITVGMSALYGEHELRSDDTLTLNAWNLVIFTHEPITRELGVSVNNSTLKNDTYSNAMEITDSPHPIYGVPMSHNSRMDHHVVMTVAIPQEIITNIWNGGSGLTTIEWFTADQGMWPGGGVTSGIGAHPPELWLDADDLNGPYNDNELHFDNIPLDGELIGFWSNSGGDRVGTSNNAWTVQGPTFKTSIQNGRDIVRFGGVDELLYRNFWGPNHTSTTQTAFTILFAGSCNASGTIFSFGADTLNGHIKIFADLSGELRFFDVTLDEGSGGASGSGVFFIAGITYNAGAVRFYHNGVFKKASSTTNTSYVIGDQTIVGKTSSGGSSFPYGGDMGEMIAYGEVLDDTDMISVMDWLNSRWGAY